MAEERLVAPTYLIGDEIANGGYTKTNPRKWSKQEIEWCMNRKKEGFSNAEIAEALSRSEISVQIKLKRETKSNDSYNEKFRVMKYLANETFLNQINPNTVLDVYAGNSWWQSNVDTCWTNDLSDEFKTDFHLDAFDLLCRLFLENEKFDVIDLDPFGSAYECFDFAIRMAQKGLVVSFGEWGHKRWKRTDFVAHRYGITDVDSWSEDYFVNEVRRIGRIHKKNLVVVDSLQYSNFLRVYFSIEPFKELSQWQNGAT